MREIDDNSRCLYPTRNLNLLDKLRNSGKIITTGEADHLEKIFKHTYGIISSKEKMMTKLYTRYRDNLGAVTDFKDKDYFEAETLKLMFWWEAAGGLVADFTEVMRHCASAALANWMINGGEDHYVENYDKSSKILTRNTSCSHKSDRIRFRGDVVICPSICLDEASSHVQHLFHYWVSLNMHKHDFIAYMEDLADQSRHNYEIRESMEGLGGCPSNAIFESSLYEGELN